MSKSFFHKFIKSTNLIELDDNGNIKAIKGKFKKGDNN